MDDVVDSRTQHMSDIHFWLFLVFFYDRMDISYSLSFLFVLSASASRICLSINLFFLVRIRSAGSSKYKKRDCSREVGGCSL